MRNTAARSAGSKSAASDEPTKPAGGAFPPTAPNASALPYAIRRTGLNLWGHVLFSVGFLAFAVFATFALVTGAQTLAARATMSAIVLVSLLAGALRIWRLKDPEVVLYADRLVRPGLFSAVALNRADIEGVSRTFKTRNGNLFTIVARPERGPNLSFNDWLRQDPVFAAWLAGPTAPTDPERKADMARVLADSRYGATRTQRSRRLKLARRVTLVFGIACAVVAAAVGLLDLPRPLALAAIAACLVIAAILVGVSRGLIVWRHGPWARPSTMAAFFPVVAVALHAWATIHLLDRDALANGSIAVGLTVFLVVSQLRFASSEPRLGYAIWMGAVSGLIAFGDGMFLNAVSTGHPEHAYAVRVWDKNVSHGRSVYYDLYLDAWGPMRAGAFSVPKRMFDAVHVGSKVCIDQYRGDLRSPWYDVRLCKPAQPPGTFPSRVEAG